MKVCQAAEKVASKLTSRLRTLGHPQNREEQTPFPAELPSRPHPHHTQYPLTYNWPTSTTNLKKITSHQFLQLHTIPSNCTVL